MSPILISLSALVAYSLVLCVLEMLSRKYKVSPEWLRRVTHISGALFVFLLYFIVPPLHLIILISIFAIVMFISHRLNIMNHIHKVSRKTIGEELLPVGFILAYIISNGKFTSFLPAVLIVGLADPIAGIMVQMYKNHLLRSAVFALITGVILYTFAGLPALTCLILACALTLVERLSPYGTDNLTIPVFASCALIFLI